MKTIDTKYGTLEIAATTTEDEAFHTSICDGPFTHGFYATFRSGRTTQQYFGLTDYEALEAAILGAAREDALAEVKRVYGPYDCGA